MLQITQKVITEVQLKIRRLEQKQSALIKFMENPKINTVKKNVVLQEIRGYEKEIKELKIIYEL